MNHRLLDLSAIGLLSYNAGKQIHDQILFEAVYKCADTGVLIGFMYASPHVPSNRNGVDEVCIYLKSDEINGIVLPINDFNLENISDALYELGYHAARVKYRRVKIDAILEDISN